jgi:hypothetical protein
MVDETDWTVHWFMLPVCVMQASVAIFMGISGAANLTPALLIGFPLLGVPKLTTVEAIGTSLLLETSGFGTGVPPLWRCAWPTSIPRTRFRTRHRSAPTAAAITYP